MVISSTIQFQYWAGHSWACAEDRQLSALISFDSRCLQCLHALLCAADVAHPNLGFRVLQDPCKFKCSIESCYLSYTSGGATPRVDRLFPTVWVLVSPCSSQGMQALPAGWS